MTVCDRGEGGGVKNHQKKRDILYGRPPICVRKRKVRPSSRPADSKKFPSVRN